MARVAQDARPLQQEETSSAKDRTCIFSITLWRWALIVRSVAPNALAICLVAFAANDKFEDLPLARRQCCDMRKNDVPRVLLRVKHRAVTRNGPFNGLKKLVR